MKKYMGVILILAVAVGIFAWRYYAGRGDQDQEGSDQSRVDYDSLVRVSGKAGSEKMAFLSGSAVRDLLARHGLALDVRKAGSVEMVTQPSGSADFLWPASRVNAEHYKMLGKAHLKTEDIFHSPIVLYSWDQVTDALVSAGVVEQIDDVYYVDFPALVKLVLSGRKWTDLGLNGFYGSVVVRSTHPAKSNSGNMFAALLANTFNNGNVVTEAELDVVLPKLEQAFGRLGHMEHSSGVLFEMFLEQGAGAYPLIVGYENQLVEFSLAHPEHRDLLRSKVRILYPRPTVWASHPIIAISENGKRLAEALRDEEIQSLAWRDHGFRTGLTAGAVDPDELGVKGIAPSISAIMPTPSVTVMERITQTLSQR